MHLLTDALCRLNDGFLELGGRHDVLAPAVERFADGARGPSVLCAFVVLEHLADFFNSGASIQKAAAVTLLHLGREALSQMVLL